MRTFFKKISQLNFVLILLSFIYLLVDILLSLVTNHFQMNKVDNMSNSRGSFGVRRDSATFFNFTQTVL